jgi:hypothetical protein
VNQNFYVQAWSQQVGINELVFFYVSITLLAIVMNTNAAASKVRCSSNFITERLKSVPFTENMLSLAVLWMDQTQFDVVFQFITGIYPSHMAASKFRRDMSSRAVPQGQLKCINDIRTLCTLLRKRYVTDNLYI